MRQRQASLLLLLPFVARSFNTESHRNCRSDLLCRVHSMLTTCLSMLASMVQQCRQALSVIGPLIDWISETLSRGYTNLQGLMECPDHRGIA